MAARGNFILDLFLEFIQKAVTIKLINLWPKIISVEL